MFLVPGQTNPPTSSSSTATSITLQWDDLPGSAVETYTVIQDGVDVVAGITTNKAIADGLIPNTNYEFQVKANNSAGDGQPSNQQIFVTSMF